MRDEESSSTISRRVVINDPSEELIAAIQAHVELPPNTANQSWKVGGVREVQAYVQITRITHHGSEGTTEQPIIWDEPSR